MKQLFKALAGFQREVKPIHKGTKGFGYTYADLPTILEKINPLLEKHGLGFTQIINSHDGENYLNTLVFHVETGELIESNCIIKEISLAKMNEYQVFGSGVTYFRRYTLSSMLGLVTDKDIDACGEQIPSPKTPEKKERLSRDRFKDALNAVQNGKITKDELYKRFDLTNVQSKALELC
jgi:hypothetical protein